MKYTSIFSLSLVCALLLLGFGPALPVEAQNSVLLAQTQNPDTAPGESTGECPPENSNCGIPDPDEEGPGGGSTGGTGTGGSRGGLPNNPNSGRTNTGLCAGIPNTVEVNYTCIPFGDRLGDCSSAGSLSLRCVRTVGGAVEFVIRVGLILSGIVAVIMIMLGGYQLLLSRGDPDGFKKGRRTVVQAAVGLMIVLLAYTIVQFITNLTGNNGLGL